MAKKLKVFAAHSFDKEIPADENKSDTEVATWFMDLMRKRPLSYTVITGSKPAPGPIAEKIQADIADCSCVIGIFTKRHYDENLSKWLSSQFVLCECACAIGFYYNTNKLICGFYEEGIDPRDLALITIGGLELMPFRRGDIEKDKSKFIEYLRKIPDMVTSGGYRGQYELFRPPYKQQGLRKIYTIYRNGNVTIQNINKMLITDAERLNKDDKGQITHEIWHSRVDIPSLTEMLNTSIDKRKEKAFLHGIFRYINQKKIKSPLSITVEEEAGKRACFTVSFRDKDGNPIRLKNQDIIRYQYAWGIPKAYALFEEDLEPSGTEIKESAYNQAEVVANHELVQQLILELRFERGKGEIFSKSPFFQTTSSFSGLAHWSRAKDMPITEEDDHEIWFQTYRLAEANFQGKIRVMWRPSSKE